jgi:undecaprenyl diphosphate synthase
MDGNRRWAKERGLPTLTGHAKGYNRIEPLVNDARDRGIKYVTFWAFSTENWNRSHEEVEYLMELFRKLFKNKAIKKLVEKGGRIRILGELDPFPKDLQENIRAIVEESRHNEKIIINIGLNYGGRAEILRAVNNLLKDYSSSERSESRSSADRQVGSRQARTIKNMTEDIFSKFLYTEGEPDPDIVIRTGGEYRLSGFLPWQAVYSELFFVKKYWPDFSAQEFEKVLKEYAGRQRRFGS